MNINFQVLISILPQWHLTVESGTIIGAVTIEETFPLILELDTSNYYYAHVVAFIKVELASWHLLR